MNTKIIVPSILHFLVDALSVFVVWRLAVDEFDLMILIILYDFLAFIPQPLFGALLEKSRDNAIFASIGCAMVAFGVIAPPVMAVLLFGIGNSLFHVAMGDIVVRKSKKSWPLGVFIAAGSVGLGVSLSFNSFYVKAVLFLAIVIFGVWNCFINYEKEENFSYESKETKAMPLLIVLIAAGVFVRGFLGPYNNQTWQSGVALPFLVSFGAIFLGKAVGGFLLDAFGPIPVIVTSVLLNLLGVFTPGIMITSFIGIFGVNILMALTMDFIRRSAPKDVAFGFGLLAASLFFGYFMGDLIKGYSYAIWIPITFVILNGASLIYVSITLQKNNRLDLLGSIRKE